MYTLLAEGVRQYDANTRLGTGHGVTGVILPTVAAEVVSCERPTTVNNMPCPEEDALPRRVFRSWESERLWAWARCKEKDKIWAVSEPRTGMLG